MLERVIELAPGANASAAAPGLGVAVLAKLIDEAREAGSGTRRSLAGKINRALLRLPSTLPARVAADFLQLQLEQKRLNDLVDAQGRSARSVAVEALLELGFPYALEVTPEDLDSLRREGRRPLVSRAGIASVAMVAGGAVAELSALVGHSESEQLAGISRALLSIAVVAWLASRRPRSVTRRWGLVVLALLGAAMAFSTSVSPLLGIGVVLAGLFLYPRP